MADRRYATFAGEIRPTGTSWYVFGPITYYPPPTNRPRPSSRSEAIIDIRKGEAVTLWGAARRCLDSHAGIVVRRISYCAPRTTPMAVGRMCHGADLTGCR